MPVTAVLESTGSILVAAVTLVASIITGKYKLFAIYIEFRFVLCHSRHMFTKMIRGVT